MPSSERYERIADKAKRGEYELVLPLDYIIMENLPTVGETFAGLYPLGETVPGLRKKKFSKLSPDQLSARLRSLQDQGLVIASKSVGTGGNNIWQRTERAVQMLAESKTTNGGDGGVA